MGDPGVNEQQNSRVVLVTGTTGGIGSAIAAGLTRRGWRVFGSSRRSSGDNSDVLRLDVTDDDSVRVAIETVLSRAGRLDAVVNNAGVDLAGAVEETSVSEAKALFEANFFGVHRLVREALPVMRAQGSGRLLVIGSVSGFIPIPFDAFYAASKHALEGYVATLAFEAAPFGVQCGLVEPGFVRTSLREHKTSVRDRLAAYATARERAENSFDRAVATSATLPAKVADAVAASPQARRMPLHKAVGSDGKTLPLMNRLLPAPLFSAGMRRRF